MNINNNGALGSSGTFNISGTATIDNTSANAVTVANNNPITWGADLTYAGTKDLNLGSGTVTIGANRTLTLSGTSPLTIGGNFANSASSGTKTITIGGSGAGSLILNGTINNGGSAATALTVNNANAVVTLAGNSGSGYTGATTLSAGTINVNSVGLSATAARWPSMA